MKRKRRGNSSRKKVKVSPRREAETPKALLNDAVLQNIFKYLDYKDLKSCRDVKNTVWLKNSTKAWCALTKVVLSGSLSDPKHVEKYLNQTEATINATNYTLNNFGMFDYNLFFERFGHSIKFLELHDFRFKTVDEFRQIIYTKCPNLEKLILEEISFFNWIDPVEPMEWEAPQFGEQKNLKFLKVGFSGRSIPITWMEIFSHFTGLEALEARTSTNIYEVISRIRQHDPEILKLKHIDFRDHEESIHLLLLDPNLSFETIRIRCDPSEGSTLSDILDLHAQSLKEASLFARNFFSRMKLLPRQRLVKLERLHIEGSLHSMDFLRYTPNLRKFHIDLKGICKVIWNHPNLRMKACKELKLERCELERIGGLSTEYFLNAFPNVEIFEIPGLNNSQFSMICERWTKLKSFKVYSSSEVDTFGILGFNPDCEVQTSRNPNIANLKDLQTFSMKSTKVGGYEDPNWEKGQEMRNADVVLAELEKLPELKKFELLEYQLIEEPAWNRIFTKYSGD